MTTVATDGRSIAADGRSCAGNEIRTEDADKLHELADGSVVGIAGDRVVALTALRELLRADEQRREPGPVEGEYALLRLHPSGAIALYEGSLSAPFFVDPPFTIGTGGEFARGAMAMGASPKKAVEIAHRYDCRTGPKITVKRPTAA